MIVGDLVEQCLVIKVEKIQEGEKSYHKFSQPRSIQNNLEAIGMTDCNRKPTPTANDLPLGAEIGSKLVKQDWFM